MVMAVGKDNPLATTVWAPEGSIRTILPDPAWLGSGNPGLVIDSSTYKRSRSSNARPRTVVSPVAHVLNWPLGVSFRTCWVPGSIGKGPRLPKKKLPWYASAARPTQAGSLLAGGDELAETSQT